jgi:hypothetical protein
MMWRAVKMPIPEEDVIARTAAQLAEELFASHDAVMAVFRFAAAHPNPALQLDAMKAATRMMQANAVACSALKRLGEDGCRTFTYVHKEEPWCPPQKIENE